MNPKPMSGDLKSLYVVTGDESLLVERAVAQVVEAALERCGPPQLNHTAFRASEPNAGEAFSAARTLPMMASLRLVVLRELDQASDALMEVLVEYARAPVDTSVVVVTGPGTPKTRKGGKNWGVRLRNALKGSEHAHWIKCASSEVRPARFVVEQAASAGHRLSLTHANLLVELVGRDLSLLASEVEKLTLHAEPGAPIRAADIHRVCSLVSEAVVWDLTAGLAARDAEQALVALHRLLEDGDSEHRLLAMISWQYRTLLQMAAAIRAGERDDAIRRRLRIRPQLFRRVRGQAHRLPRAADALERLCTANRRMNSHRAGGRRVLEDLVVALCA